MKEQIKYINEVFLLNSVWTTEDYCPVSENPITETDTHIPVTSHHLQLRYIGSLYICSIAI